MSRHSYQRCCGWIATPAVQENTAGSTRALSSGINGTDVTVCGQCKRVHYITVSGSRAARLLWIVDQWLRRLYISSASQPAFSPSHDVTPNLKVQWRYWTITAIALGVHIYIMWLRFKKTPPAGCKTTYNIGTERERQPATRKGDLPASARDDSLE